MKLRSKKGITLIALVITIIVLVVLVGVVISSALGNDGILGKFTKSIKQNAIAENLENLEMEYATYKMYKYGKNEKNFSVYEFLNYAINDNAITAECIVEPKYLTENTKRATVKMANEYLYQVEIDENRKIIMSYLGIASEISSQLKRAIKMAVEWVDEMLTNNINWSSTFPLTNAPSVIGELTTNGTYGFKQSGTTLIPENKGINSSTAEAYYPIDLSACPTTEIYTLTLNAQISSESGYDFGWMVITDSPSATTFTSSSSSTCGTSSGTILNTLVYKSGSVSATDYTVTLSGGKMYYLHFGYRKDGSVSNGSDSIIINNISLSGLLTIVKNVPQISISLDNRNRWTIMLSTKWI